ncbi:MAG: carboxymuconolactone decarboxylase family protein [Bacillota bacterium]|nr:carboxymuconolactone decarboxylase family protein [Bacillota bacterium]
MKPTPPPFVQQIEKRDPELYQAVVKIIELAMTPGALDAKTKTFIALALDAYIGSERGVIALSNRARELGATDQEINEVLRIAYYVSGSKTLATSNNAFPPQS